MTFEEAMTRYWQLRARYEAKALGADAFEAAVQDMQVHDEHGNLWQIGVQSGAWYRLENGAWVEDSPPEKPAPAVYAPAPSIHSTRSVTNQPQPALVSRKGGQTRIIIFAILATLSVIIGCCCLIVLWPRISMLINILLNQLLIR